MEVQEEAEAALEAPAAAASVEAASVAASVEDRVPADSAEVRAPEDSAEVITTIITITILISVGRLAADASARLWHPYS